MKCPRCKSVLTRESVENELIDACTSCGGMWLHTHQLNRLLKESGGDVELCSINTRPHTDEHRHIKCRECKNSVMKKINFLDYSDIVFDYCPLCGSFWLDGDELSKMHKYIRRVDEGSHAVRNISAYDLLVKLSRISYVIFH